MYDAGTMHLKLKQTNLGIRRNFIGFEFLKGLLIVCLLKRGEMRVVDDVN